MDRTSQARENREYVRKLLRERQPDFAVALESVVQELCCQVGQPPVTKDGCQLCGSPELVSSA